MAKLKDMSLDDLKAKKDALKSEIRQIDVQIEITEQRAKLSVFSKLAADPATAAKIKELLDLEEAMAPAKPHKVSKGFKKPAKTTSPA